MECDRTGKLGYAVFVSGISEIYGHSGAIMDVATKIEVVFEKPFL